MFKGKGVGLQKRGNTQKRRNPKVDRAPSLAVNSDWKVVEEFDLSQLLKLVANVMNYLSSLYRIDVSYIYVYMSCYSLQKFKIFSGLVMLTLTMNLMNVSSQGFQNH